jgi:hypothetical protein
MFLRVFILTIILTSCTSHIVPLQNLPEPFPYCGLLNMPTRPYPAIEPRAYLGTYLATNKVEQAIPNCKEGLFIQAAGIINGTPAEKAGLRDGDVILSLNNVPTCNNAEHIISSFKKTIEQQKIGVPLPLEILRNDKKLVLTVTLDEQPTHVQREAEHPEIDRCPQQTSLLENTLQAQNVLPFYNTLVNELYRKSNVVHNPGSIIYEKEFYPFQLNEVTYLMRHPLAEGAVTKELSRRISAPLEEMNWQINTIFQKTASLLSVGLLSSVSPTEVTFPALLRTMEETKNRIDEALGNLTPEEKMLMQNAALNLDDDKQWNTVLDISMKIDRTKLFNAFSPFLAFLTRDNLELLRQDLVTRFRGSTGSILYEAQTPIGKVIVGGVGPNVYTEDAALILDLGGDDLYLNNAGGTRPGMPIALVIDWRGNDRYLSRENFSQGAGILGGGFLIDLGGDDTFVSLDGSQGVGFWGIGLLYHGDGNSVFSARKLCQGTGQMGIGLLINRNGDDKYLCSYAGQGLGLFGGAGILIDEAGNDLYQLGGLEPDFRDPTKATQSLGQGFGLGIRADKDKFGVPGGIGMLIDKKGDDVYIADYFAQGASYYYGLGILDDQAGNDQYISGRYSQGAGIHSSIGILIDRAGNDFYYSSVGAGQGMGHDFGVGFLEDDAGDNYIYGGSLVQGASTNGSLGILINAKRKGDNKDEALFNVEVNSMGIRIGKEHARDAAVIEIGVRKE